MVTDYSNRMAVSSHCEGGPSFFIPQLERAIMSSTATFTNRLIDIHEVAELIGCTDRHVRNMVKAGQIPAFRKIGGLTRWSLSEIHEWLNAGCPADGQND